MIWKDVIIDGYWTDYEVSDTGKLRIKSTKELIPFHLSDKGYCRVYLRKAYMDSHIERTDYLLHRLVLMAFDPIDNPDEMTGDHRNKDKLNNSILNLRWLTREDNSIESHKFGRLYPCGENANHVRYNEAQIIAVCELLEENTYTIPAISELTNVSQDTICKIKAKKQWLNISSEYDIPDTKPNINVRTYSEEDKQAVIDILLENFYTPTKDIIRMTNLPYDNATRMFVNRVRHKLEIEIYSNKD